MNEAIKIFEQSIIDAINKSQLPVEVIRLVLENTLYKVATAITEPVQDEEVEDNAEST